MDTKKIRKFFDDASANWDSISIINSESLNLIFSNAEIGGNQAVLDVACGTGILIPEYQKYGVKSISAIDFSQKMIDIARTKFDNVDFICADVESYHFDKKFDRIVVFNAFPHFPNPERLIKKLSTLLKPNGILTVAHDTGKQNIDKYHQDNADSVSIELLEADALADIFSNYLEVTACISTDNIYQVVGCLK